MFRREPNLCVSPAVSPHLSYRERRAVLMGVASVLRHLAFGGLLVALDFLVFWILDQVHHQVKGDVVARGEVPPDGDVAPRHHRYGNGMPLPRFLQLRSRWRSR